MQPEQIRKAIAEILAQDDYGASRGSSIGFVGKLVEPFHDLLAWLDRLSFTSPALYTAIIAGLVLLLLLLIGHIAWAIRSAQRLRGGHFADDSGEFSKGETLASLKEKAARAEAAGDLGEALRWHFRCVLWLCQRSRPGSLRSGWTNRECLVALGTQEQRRRLLRVVEHLDRSWYGRQALEASDYQRLRQVCRTFGDEPPARKP